MFTYVFLKSARLGIFGDSESAAHLYHSLLDTFVTTEDGLVNLNDCCEVAGLGGKDNRSGDYEYYINERVRANDPKGIGPLIWAALEYERL
jgi:unsaturated rhamnogalacturonyl hydrolase